MRRLLSLVALFALPACGVSGRDPYAGWDLYEEPGGRFTVQYLSPPWTQCSESEYEEDCHECPARLIGGVCGSSASWIALWVPPALLDPEYLLIPPYKLEVSWFTASRTPMELATDELRALTNAGLEPLIEARRTTLQDGTEAVEIAYAGSVALVIGDDPADRPDTREYHVLYVSGDGLTYRVALDTAISIDLPEVRDMLASFSIGGVEP